MNAGCTDSRHVLPKVVPENSTVERRLSCDPLKPNLLIVIATYNELENLPDLLDQIFECLPDAEILVVDDNSPDGTPDWLLQQCETNHSIHALIRQSKQGLGTAAREGFQWALERDFEWIATMDADFSHSPDDLKKMVDAATTSSQTDVVIGSRYIGEGKIEGWSWFRRISSRLINLHSRFWLRLPTRDNSGALRIYRKDVFLESDLHNNLQSKGYVYLHEVLWRLKGIDARCLEIPITFRDRTRGKSKINYREAFSAVWTIIRLSFSKP